MKMKREEGARRQGSEGNIEELLGSLELRREEEIEGGAGRRKVRKRRGGGGLQTLTLTISFKYFCYKTDLCQKINKKQLLRK